ncbi:hypothetical protein IQ07DRAFT_316103 [Pyrenochaeta sp. DS3sAY3a]|nr:hypothetical protein IQ07DRAFT_316103 [Pyrenochaeta sp. DS3sAY3a]
MSSSQGSILVVTCRESACGIKASEWFNISSPNQVIQSVGGRTPPLASAIPSLDTQNRIGMIVVLQHTNCAWVTGNADANLRSDLQFLKGLPAIRDDIQIMGYLLDDATKQLKEVMYVRFSNAAHSPPSSTLPHIPVSLSPSTLPVPARPPLVVQSPVMPLLWHSTNRPWPNLGPRYLPR